MIDSFSLNWIIILAWTLPWKAYAVWTAAKHNHKKWFIALLLVNTLAILEIFYILKIAKKSAEEVKADFRRAWNSIK